MLIRDRSSAAVSASGLSPGCRRFKLCQLDACLLNPSVCKELAVEVKNVIIVRFPGIFAHLA